MLLGLCGRLAATALIHPLAWELPYATGTTLKRKNFFKKIKKILTHAARWMNLEGLLHGAISESEKAYVWFHLYLVSGVAKCTETGSRMVLY